MQYSELTSADRIAELRSMIRQLELKAHVADRMIRINEPLTVHWKDKDTNRFQNAKQAVNNAENDLAELTIGLAVLRSDLAQLQEEIPLAKPPESGDNIREFSKA